jgi:PAS domain S-box-containing protein
VKIARHDKRRQPVGEGTVAESALAGVTDTARKLEEELQRLQQQLQATIERGQEELRSVREELTIENRKLKSRIEEEGRAEDDIHHLIEISESVAIFLDRHLRIRRYTPLARRLFNITSADLGRPLAGIGTQLIDEHLHDDLVRVRERLDRVERQVRAHDARRYLMRIVPYRTADDRIDGVVLSFVDVTAHEHAHARVRESERRFSAVFNQRAAGICYATPDGRLLLANERLCSLFGWAPADLGGRGIHDLVDGDSQKAAALIERLLSERGPLDIERRLVREDGTATWVAVNLSAVRDERGEVDAIVAVALDVTQRKDSAEVARAGEERLRRVLDSIVDHAVITMDASGIIQGWNTGAVRMFGFSAAEAVGQCTDIIFTPEDRARRAHLDEIRRASQTGRAADERWHQRNDGTRFYVSGVLSPLGAQPEHGFVKVARDLTERKQHEEALRREHETLESRIQERTSELAASNEALERELAERREAEERVRNLLARLITVQEDERRRIARDLHDDLGQKMTALHLKLEALRRALADSPHHAQVQDAQAYVQKLDRDLDFFTWELRPAALYDLGLVPALRDYVTQWSKNYNIPAEFDSIGITRKRLRAEVEINMYRIAQEALNNVYKHARATQVAVLVQLRKGEVVMSVEDNGVGFDVSGVDAHGRGIGLVGMRERAALMNGKVEIERAAAGGTAVIVAAPV